MQRPCGLDQVHAFCGGLRSIYKSPEHDPGLSREELLDHRAPNASGTGGTLYELDVSPPTRSEGEVDTGTVHFSVEIFGIKS